MKVYGRILSQAREPVIVHWLGEMFDPALAGYWGSHDRDRQVETLLAIVNEYAAKIDGVKVSLLDQAREIGMRKRFPASVRMYTGDDFDYPTTISAATGSATPTHCSASSTSSRRPRPPRSRRWIGATWRRTRRSWRRR